MTSGNHGKIGEPAITKIVDNKSISMQNWTKLKIDCENTKVSRAKATFLTNPALLIKLESPKPVTKPKNDHGKRPLKRYKA